MAYELVSMLAVAGEYFSEVDGGGHLLAAIRLSGFGGAESEVGRDSGWVDALPGAPAGIDADARTDAVDLRSERSIIVTGGWQASKETAYVDATRARRGTDWYIARDQLGNDGQDADRIKRLAQNMSHSCRQKPSLAYPELPGTDYRPGFDRAATLIRTRIPGISRGLQRIAKPPPKPERPR